MREPNEPVLSSWVVHVLRNSASGAAPRSAAQRAAIMNRVRHEPAPRVLSAPMRASRWTRRGLLSPVGGAGLAAVLMAMIWMRGLQPPHAGFEASALVRGDSVVPVRDARGAWNGRGDTTGDTLGARLLDTLSIVEFILRGPTVHAATAVGDFNAWRGGATTLTYATDGTWRARVLVPRDALRFAIVVNGTQLVAAPLVAAPLLRQSAVRIIPDSI